MACNLTSGRTNYPCTDSMGGLDFVEFCDYHTLTISGSYTSGSVTYDVVDTDVITAFNGTPTWYKYDLNSTACNFTQNINSSEDNGTSYFEQVLSLSLQKLDKATHKELKLMLWGKPHVRVHDRNGNYFIMGLTKGAKVTGGTIATGGAGADFNGYTLTLTANEPAPANFLTGSATT